jgi:general secretion pathway protein G
VRGRVSNSGFTLIEMLVVFALLALLLTIAAPPYLSSLDQSREKVRQQNLATIRDALDKFKADQGRYPGELSELVSKRYLRQIPPDPVSKSSAWVAVQHPSREEAGVYDVAPPLETSSAAPATAVR